MSPRRVRSLTLTLAVTAAVLAWPAASQADQTTFGSSLSVPATRDTANNLAYAGTDISIPGQVVHVNHDGADTALWNTAQASGSSQAPADGQVMAIKQEGCAQPAPGGPSPLTQIHYQEVVPQPDGQFKVGVTTQAFDLPVCGFNGAGPSTVTTYDPENFCVHKGDYVAFNDEGGWDPAAPSAYPSGVPYSVIGAVGGSTMDSFIRNNGTANGAVFNPADSSNHDGFASNSGSELMAQMVLATGPDAVWLCPGGTRGQPHTPAGTAPVIPAGPPATLSTRTAPVIKHGVVSLAVSCRGPQACSGTLSLSAGAATSGRVGAGAPSLARARFAIAAHKTAKIRLRAGKRLVALVRKAHGHLRVSLTVVSGPGGPANTATQTLTLARGR